MRIILSSLLLLVILSFSFTACNRQSERSENKTNIDLKPLEQSGSDSLLIRDATIDSLELTVAGPSVQMKAAGYFPDACTHIHAITKEQEGNTFRVHISCSRPKEAMCAEVITRFSQTLDLPVEGMKPGTYEVEVNGMKKSFTLK